MSARVAHGSGRPAVFLDRDGVIVDEVQYLSSPDQLVLIPRAADAIARLNQHGIPVVVVTNQAGVARGYFPEERLTAIHRRLDELLAAGGARIDRYEYCPHHPTEGLPPYRVDCACRKPRPGMLLRAATALGLDLSRSVMIGDKLSDLQAGIAAGCRVILVRTGYGFELEVRAYHSISNQCIVVGDIFDGIDWLLQNSGT
jgi:D-glycero-D-manno-heptose 1,7-bisphosphate phosphatase